MRELTTLIPRAKAKADELVKACEAQGLKIKITDTLRNKAEQDALYAQGRTKPGNIVTNVKYPNSMHNWGVAFDFCRNDGAGAYNDTDGFFSKVGSIGKSIGLEWGGDWKSIVDRPHFQLPDWGSTPAKLKTLYGTPDNFISQNGGKVMLPTLKKGSKNGLVPVVQAVCGLYCDMNIDVDGIFGKDTCNAVKAFQTKCGIASDGIVGKNTWAKIKEVLL